MARRLCALSRLCCSSALLYWFGICQSWVSCATDLRPTVPEAAATLTPTRPPPGPGGCDGGPALAFAGHPVPSLGSHIRSSSMLSGLAASAMRPAAWAGARDPAGRGRFLAWRCLGAAGH